MCCLPGGQDLRPWVLYRLPLCGLSKAPRAQEQPSDKILTVGRCRRGGSRLWGEVVGSGPSREGTCSCTHAPAPSELWEDTLASDVLGAE